MIAGMDTARFDDPNTLHFLFDYISHNAYLAWGPARGLAARHGLAFEPVPVVFGAMLSAYGQVGPAEIPAKSRWMLRDVLRKAALLKLPIAPPHTHPFRSLVPLRWTLAVGDADARLKLIDALWRATWAESREVACPAVVSEIATSLGCDVEQLARDVDSDAVKQQLRANTDAALAAGAFGVPTVFARGQIFWGYDDFGALERFLEGRDPLGDSPALSPWSQVRPSVQRRR